MNSQNPSSVTGSFRDSLCVAKPAHNWLGNNKAGLFSADLYQFGTHDTYAILHYITQYLVTILSSSNRSSRPLQYRNNYGNSVAPKIIRHHLSKLTAILPIKQTSYEVADMVP
jgi:hypothetical protein